MAGIKEHGIRLDELPSIILPLYYGLMPILLCVFGLLYGFAAVLRGREAIAARCLHTTMASEVGYEDDVIAAAREVLA